MTDAEARTRIERMTAADREPILEPEELDDLVVLSKRADDLGRAPNEVGWTSTYDLNAAACVGWGWKAGKATADFDFSDDAGNYNRQQIFEMCRRQEEAYAKKATTTIYMSTAVLPWRITA